jgi:hypothetical protein
VAEADRLTIGISYYSNFVMDSIACGCANASGEVSSSGTCQYMGGAQQGIGELANYVSLAINTQQLPPELNFDYTLLFPSRADPFASLQCYKATAWAREMDQVFSTEFCGAGFNGGSYTKSVCKTVKLCLRFPDLPQYKDYYTPC